MFIKNLMANIHMVILKKFEKINTIKSKNSTNFYRCKIINSNKILNIKKNFIRYRRWVLVFLHIR